MKAYLTRFMKLTNLCLCLNILVSSLFFIACHKDHSNNNPVEPTDAYENIYTINSQGNSNPAIILCSPFPLPPAQERVTRACY